MSISPAKQLEEQPAVDIDINPSSEQSEGEDVITPEDEAWFASGSDAEVIQAIEKDMHTREGAKREKRRTIGRLIEGIKSKLASPAAKERSLAMEELMEHIDAQLAEAREPLAQTLHEYQKRYGEPAEVTSIQDARERRDREMGRRPKTAESKGFKEHPFTPPEDGDLRETLEARIKHLESELIRLAKEDENFVTNPLYRQLVAREIAVRGDLEALSRAEKAAEKIGEEENKRRATFDETKETFKETLEEGERGILDQTWTSEAKKYLDAADTALAEARGAYEKANQAHKEVVAGEKQDRGYKGPRVMEKDPRYLKLLNNAALKHLKTEDAVWFLKSYTGDLSKSGKLLQTDGTESPFTPYELLGDTDAKAVIETQTKEAFASAYPDDVARFGRLAGPDSKTTSGELATAKSVLQKAQATQRDAYRAYKQVSEKRADLTVAEREYMKDTDPELRAEGEATLRAQLAEVKRDLDAARAKEAKYTKIDGAKDAATAAIRKARAEAKHARETQEPKALKAQQEVLDKKEGDLKEAQDRLASAKDDVEKRAFQASVDQATIARDAVRDVLEGSREQMFKDLARRIEQDLLAKTQAVERTYQEALAKAPTLQERNELKTRIRQLEAQKAKLDKTLAPERDTPVLVMQRIRAREEKRMQEDAQKAGSGPTSFKDIENVAEAKKEAAAREVTRKGDNLVLEAEKKKALLALEKEMENRELARKRRPRLTRTQQRRQFTERAEDDDWYQTERARILATYAPRKPEAATTHADETPTPHASPTDGSEQDHPQAVEGEHEISTRIKQEMANVKARSAIERNDRQLKMLDAMKLTSDAEKDAIAHSREEVQNERIEIIRKAAELERAYSDYLGQLEYLDKLKQSNNPEDQILADRVLADLDRRRVYNNLEVRYFPLAGRELKPTMMRAGSIRKPSKKVVAEWQARFGAEDAIPPRHTDDGEVLLGPEDRQTPTPEKAEPPTIRHVEPTGSEPPVAEENPELRAEALRLPFNELTDRLFKLRDEKKGLTSEFHTLQSVLDERVGSIPKTKRELDQIRESGHSDTAELIEDWLIDLRKKRESVVQELQAMSADPYADYDHLLALQKELAEFDTPYEEAV